MGQALAVASATATSGCFSTKSTSRTSERSNVAPAGSECTTAPETMSGAPRRASGRVGLGAAAVEDEHAPAPWTVKVRRSRDLDRGVLVDPDADQVGRGGDHGHQPAVAGPLGEVLVDDDALEQPEPGAELAVPLPGRDALVAHRDHELAHDRGARRGAADDGAAVVGAVQGVAERGAGEALAQLELAAAAHEDAGGLVDAGRRASASWASARFGGLTTDGRGRPSRVKTSRVGRRPPRPGTTTRWGSGRSGPGGPRRAGRSGAGRWPCRPGPRRHR